MTAAAQMSQRHAVGMPPLWGCLAGSRQATFSKGGCCLQPHRFCLYAAYHTRRGCTPQIGSKTLPTLTSEICS